MLFNAVEGAFNELGEWSVGAVSYRFCFICGINGNTTDVINGANSTSVFWFSLSQCLYTGNKGV